MSSTTLYRKYRPIAFDGVVGQEHVVRTIKNAVASGSVAHAYLFAGPRGTGKTTIARILAKAVNCSGEKASAAPCGLCVVCKDVGEGKAMDIIEIDAASNRGIDEAREIREAVRVAPAQFTRKVYIIDEAHQLTKDAFSTLLKTLEEPPEHVLFILATTDPDKMPATILSRVQRFDFKKFSVDEIVGKLEKIVKSEKRAADPEALRSIASAAEGGLRDAESMLDQVCSYTTGKVTQSAVEEVLGIIGFERVASFVDVFVKRDLKEAIIFANTLCSQGGRAEELLKSLVDYFRKLALVRLDTTLREHVVPELTKDQCTRMLEQSQKWEQKELEQILIVLMDAQDNMKKTSTPILPLELALIQLLSKEESREKDRKEK